MLSLLTLLSVGHGAQLDVPEVYATIQDALDSAVDGDVIAVAPGDYCEDLRVAKSVTIRAADPTNGFGVVLSGYCAFDESMMFSSGAAVVLEDLTLEGGFWVTPLWIESGRVEGRNLTIRYGYSPDVGGGVRVGGDGTFACHDCAINYNFVGDDGGGVYSEGTVLLYDSMVCQNSADDLGGGLYLAGRSVVRRTAFVHNYALDRGGGVSVAGFGGHQLHNLVFWENYKGAATAGGAGLQVGDAADLRNSIFAEHRDDIAVDNDDEVNTGGYNLYVANLGGDVSEPYPGDILGGSVLFEDPSSSCDSSFRLAGTPNDNDALGTGDPALASGVYPNDRGIFGGIEDTAPDSDGDLFPDTIDCAPFDPQIYPGAQEQCNGIDDDCDGVVPSDERDSDDDGYATCEGDCDDTEPTAYPGAPGIVGDDIDNDCDGLGECYLDDDDDGYGVGTVVSADANDSCGVGLSTVATDCDDTDGGINPVADERCDGIDNDCDSLVDDDDEDVLDPEAWYADVDGDGHGDPDATVLACDAPDAYVSDSTDCDDLDSSINRQAEEVCDGVDNDCDDAIDDDDGDVVGQSTWYDDGDGDSYGDPGDSVVSCEPPLGHVADDTDCDDRDADENPAAEEVCDGVDNDCDGAIDDADGDVIGQSTWYPDADADGHGDPAGPFVLACGRPLGTTASYDDCDDNDVNTFPGAPEQCDGIDNDCNNEVDEDITFEDWWPDADGDGFGDPSATPSSGCAAPPGTVNNALDCDDTVATINPAIPELPCDGVDNDCSPATPDDDGSCYPDSGDTGDTGVPPDTDTDTDTDDTDTDSDTDTDTDTDTDMDTETTAATGTATTGPTGTGTKAPPPATPDYGCGCASTRPSSIWLPVLLGALPLGRRRR